MIRELMITPIAEYLRDAYLALPGQGVAGGGAIGWGIKRLSRIMTTCLVTWVGRTGEMVVVLEIRWG